MNSGLVRTLQVSSSFFRSVWKGKGPDMDREGLEVLTLRLLAIRSCSSVRAIKPVFEVRISESVFSMSLERELNCPRTAS